MPAYQIQKNINLQNTLTKNESSPDNDFVLSGQIFLNLTEDIEQTKDQEKPRFNNAKNIAAAKMRT